VIGLLAMEGWLFAEHPRNQLRSDHLLPPPVGFGAPHAILSSAYQNSDNDESGSTKDYDCQRDLLAAAAGRATSSNTSASHRERRKNARTIIGGGNPSGAEVRSFNLSRLATATSSSGRNEPFNRTLNRRQG
jgi:hypothetical protein